MIGDIWLIVNKEVREVVLRAGSSRATILNLALILLVFGVVLPLQAGAAWVESWWLLFSWTWLPLFLVSALVADSFAGERERHTLETLLTTALSDRTILFGKIAAAVSYGYGMLLSVMLLSLLTVNVVWGVREGRLLMFSASVTVGVLVIGLLITLLIAAIGVMISLKAKTVRQAGQALSLGILAILWIPGLIIALGARALSEVQQQALWEWASMLDGRAVAAVGALVLLVLDAVFVGIAMRRFKRSRLSLD